MPGRVGMNAFMRPPIPACAETPGGARGIPTRPEAFSSIRNTRIRFRNFKIVRANHRRTTHRHGMILCGKPMKSGSNIRGAAWLEPGRYGRGDQRVGVKTNRSRGKVFRWSDRRRRVYFQGLRAIGYAAKRTGVEGTGVNNLVGRDGKTHHRHQQNADETKEPVTTHSVFHNRLSPFGSNPISPPARFFPRKHTPGQGVSILLPARDFWFSGSGSPAFRLSD